MTPQEFAIGLNNAQRGDLISPAEEVIARENRLVVIFGCADGNMQFRGAIRDEIDSESDEDPVWFIFVHPDGYIMRGDHSCNCNYCNFTELQGKAKEVEALWFAEPGYSWTYRTEIPHATFEVFDGANTYCRGIVFSLDDVKAV